MMPSPFVSHLRLMCIFFWDSLEPGVCIGKSTLSSIRVLCYRLKMLCRKPAYCTEQVGQTLACTNEFPNRYLLRGLEKNRVEGFLLILNTAKRSSRIKRRATEFSEQV